MYKNGELWKMADGLHSAQQRMPESHEKGKYKVRVEMGWGDNTSGFLWQGRARIDDGQIVSVETCFRGQNVLAPTPEMQDNPDINNLGNKLLEYSNHTAEWTCMTFKNVSTRHPQTAALIFELEGDPNSRITIEVNGQIFAYSLSELLEGSRSAHLQPYNSEALLFHRAVPEHAYCFQSEWHDDEKERDCDAYHVEIKQVNEQYAWISPVFVHS
ncbi:hypothetical protein Elgi_17370 [Paenibacillus elgii]|nr:hypothetical protein Elgi_17370 [Paenibacillus elgii]